jgi:hypothetical protein
MVSAVSASVSPSHASACVDAVGPIAGNELTVRRIIDFCMISSTCCLHI